jgi:hypothetical protein
MQQFKLAPFQSFFEPEKPEILMREEEKDHDIQQTQSQRSHPDYYPG